MSTGTLGGVHGASTPFTTACTQASSAFPAGTSVARGYSVRNSASSCKSESPKATRQTPRTVVATSVRPSALRARAYAMRSPAPPAR